MRISKARARFTTSRPMLPRPMMPSVLPRSSLPMSFFFSHLPARVEAPACGMWRAMASISARVCSATETALPPGVFITSTPACGGGVQVHVVHAHAGAADHAQFGRLFENRRSDLDGAADQQGVGFGKMLGVFLGIGDDDVPAGLDFSNSIPAAASGSAIRIFMVCALLVGQALSPANRFLQLFTVATAPSRSRLVVIWSRDRQGAVATRLHGFGFTAALA